MLRRGMTVLSVLLLGTSAHATGGTYGGEGAQLIPLKKTPVSVLSQLVVIEEGGLSKPPVTGWRAQGIYTLENPTDQPVTVQIGLPEFGCSAAGSRPCDTRGGPGGPTLLDLTVWVGFEEVKLRPGRVSRSSLGGRTARRMHTFEVTFQPREVQKIRHAYRFGTSSELGSNRLAWMTGVGAPWGGSIGKARFTLRLLERPYGIHMPAEFNVQRYVEVRDQNTGGRFVTELLLEQRDWIPKGDLILDLEPRGAVPLVGGLPCPSVHELVDDVDLWMPNDGLEAAASTAMTDAELGRCRALPRAMHGAPLEQPELREFFYGPRQVVGGRRLLLAREGSQYSPAMLTTDEWIYGRVLTQVEEARAARTGRSTGE